MAKKVAGSKKSDINTGFLIAIGVLASMVTNLTEEYGRVVEMCSKGQDKGRPIVHLSSYAKLTADNRLKRKGRFPGAPMSLFDPDIEVGARFLLKQGKPGRGVLIRDEDSFDFLCATHLMIMHELLMARAKPAGERKREKTAEPRACLSPKAKNGVRYE